MLAKTVRVTKKTVDLCALVLTGSTREQKRAFRALVEYYQKIGGRWDDEVRFVRTMVHCVDELMRRGAPIDVVQVGTLLKLQGTIDLVGGMAGLCAVINGEVPELGDYYLWLDKQRGGQRKGVTKCKHV